MKHLFKALADFQQEVPVIHKNTQGYGYTYSDLPKIFEVINPLLKKHGLGFTQLLNDSHLTTILFHAESGESIESNALIPTVTLKGMNDFQAAGSGISYFRRYALSSILGIISDKDTDAAGEQTSKPKVETKAVVKVDPKTEPSLYDKFVTEIGKADQEKRNEIHSWIKNNASKFSDDEYVNLVQQL